MVHFEEIEEWKSVVNEVRYLDWKIKVENTGDLVKLSIDAYVKDSEPPHEPTIVYHTMTIPYPYWMNQPKTTRDWKIKQIFRFICHIQVHEASEFFKVKESSPFHAHTQDSKYREFEYPIMQCPEYGN